MAPSFGMSRHGGAIRILSQELLGLLTCYPWRAPKVNFQMKCRSEPRRRPPFPSGHKLIIKWFRNCDRKQEKVILDWFLRILSSPAPGQNIKKNIMWSWGEGRNQSTLPFFILSSGSCLWRARRRKGQWKRLRDGWILGPSLLSSLLRTLLLLGINYRFFLLMLVGPTKIIYEKKKPTSRRKKTHTFGEDELTAQKNFLKE